MIKQKEGEDFSDEKIELVISYLEEGETKKSCCDVLGIKYNTARLAKIISEWKDKKNIQAKLKKSFRNKPLEKQDIITICQEYLNGEAISNIADDIYRSTNVVKNVLVRYNIPIRNASNNYFNPVFVEQDEVTDYNGGDLVFSARYNSLAEIIKGLEDNVYRICVLGKNQRYAYQPGYELADLRKVQTELNITGDWESDTFARAWQSVKDAKNRKNKNKD